MIVKEERRPCGRRSFFGFSRRSAKDRLNPRTVCALVAQKRALERTSGMKWNSMKTLFALGAAALAIGAALPTTLGTGSAEAAVQAEAAAQPFGPQWFGPGSA